MKINWIARKEINYNRVRELLSISERENHFSNFGPVSTMLERRLHELLQIDEDKAVICTCSGSVAIQILSEYYWIRSVPVFTFPSVIQGRHNSYVMLDVNEDLGPDSQDNSKLIITNLFGYVQNLSKYTDSILDNAACPFSFYKETNTCNIFPSAISLHHTKPLGFGEGGAMIVPKQDEEKLRERINFGYHNNEFHRWGLNGKMSDVSAAFIYQYLDNFDNIIKKHQRLWNIYAENITTIPQYSSGIPFCNCFPVLFEKPIPEQPAQHWWNEIVTKKYYKPLEPKLKAVDAYLRILCFPLNVDMSEKDIIDIVGWIKALKRIYG